MRRQGSAMDGWRGRVWQPRDRGGGGRAGRSSPVPMEMGGSPRPQSRHLPDVADEVSDSGNGSSNSCPIKDGRNTSHQNSASASHYNKNHNNDNSPNPDSCSPSSPDCGSGMLPSHVSNKLTVSEIHTPLTLTPSHSHDHHDSPGNTTIDQPPLVDVGDGFDDPFDICPPKPTSTVVLNPPLLLKNRERRNQIKRNNNMDTPNGTILRPGMVLLKNHLSLTDQVNIVKKCRDLGLRSGGFYQFRYREGTKLHLKMMCLGKHWDPQTSQYSDHRPCDGAKPPAIPLEFHHLIQKAIGDSHALIQQASKTTNPPMILPSMSSNICIVNFYTQNGRLGLHQDKDESKESLHQGLPVVSFSIGDSADFLYGDERDVDKAQKVVLESGDVLIFGGRSRNVFHGVATVHPTTAPKLLLEETNLRPGRLNLTFRQY